MVWEASEASGAWTNVSWSLKRFRRPPMDAVGLGGPVPPFVPQMFYTEGDTLIPVPDAIPTSVPRGVPRRLGEQAPMNPAQLQALTADFQALQDRIVDGVEAVEAQHGGATFVEDAWERPGGGGGRTRVLTAGAVWERGGVNFSQVEGEASAALKAQMNTEADRFWAAGVSLVLHPNNPHVPIVHMNVRHFALSDGTSWFGGGIDMTPHYVHPKKPPNSTTC